MPETPDRTPDRTGPRQGQDNGRAAGVSVADAARLLGLTYDGVRKRLHRGTLPGAKVDGTSLAIRCRSHSGQIDGRSLNGSMAIFAVGS
jgi:hypothetical protein